ncbi:hypothetical protein K505DRAFT_325810 [Melanomma pulvis-pyrius CBS 109.77]|uniref:Uncharacterized protein n=1 Tax=Melanomma pulvis-pyrius CBS 109.77 TaxID=1314802 RepID=A0A6A6X9C8_9PLEO|nr:hypothetical protein K505DRAFT_325810 [Melanomma pulvis-pyrius CBS 109.77]
MKLPFALVSVAALPFLLTSAAPSPSIEPTVSVPDFLSQQLFTAAETCKVYTDCTRCAAGNWRCCFSGCAGHPMPGSHTCLCVPDGKDLGASCGCT